jgi:alpha-L-glutamate ligase-like protein
VLKTWRRLRTAGVLGINQRQAEQAAYNPRRLYPLVDDKRRTKELALRAGMTVPALYGVIETQAQAARLDTFLRAHADFVIKPNHGSGGEGVLLISRLAEDRYATASGDTLDGHDLRLHVSNILGGMHSLGGQPDQALIEYYVQVDPLFEAISGGGVPDVRIVVFLGVPVMSMVRLPTRCSGGRANLHQGAIGVGIDLASGVTRTAVWRDQIIIRHPDTGVPVEGITIPRWADLLLQAARCYEMTGLGLQGVDIVLDRDLGPMMLELNARPGLSIQLANRCGLRPRLELVKRHAPDLRGVEQRVTFALHYLTQRGAIGSGSPALARPPVIPDRAGEAVGLEIGLGAAGTTREETVIGL